jgi:hypothetical protein
MIQFTLAAFAIATMTTPKDRLVFEGKTGPGHGKQIVFLSGDEEYRSEEGLVQLARILSERHGFKCTVLFSINNAGQIDPNTQDNEPGMDALDHADLCVMLLRFRHWPDSQMKHFVDFYHRGGPIIALRTSTHAFDYPADSTSAYKEFGWKSKLWPGGFGKQVLGENWVTHWGNHGHEATHGVLETQTQHPILTGVQSVFGTTDVYEAAPPSGCQILMRGQVLTGMNITDTPATHRKKTVGGVEQEVNDPMMPILWVQQRRNEHGKSNRIVTTTMGAATDLLNEGLRRILINGVYWCTGLSRQIGPNLDVNLIGEYNPSHFGFKGFKVGIKIDDLVSEYTK